MATRSDRNTLDLRVQRTYKLLKDAFVLLMSQMPYDQITVQLICEKAMVRRTTFYQHFEDKHNFLQWFVREKQQEFSELTRNLDPPIDTLAHYCLMARNLLKSLNRNEHVLHLLMDAGVQSQILIDAFSCACVEDVVQRIEESPLGREKLKGMSPVLLAEFYVGGLIAAIKWWFVNNKPCTEEELIQYLCRLVEEKKLYGQP